MITFEPGSANEPALAPSVVGGPIELAERFDADATWAALPAEHQAAIGAAALALQMAWLCQDEAELKGALMYQTALHRAATQAEHAAIDALVDLFDGVVPDAHRLTASGQPRVPSLIGMVCARCGCSEADACAGGCSWARPDLCSACVDVGESGAA